MFGRDYGHKPAANAEHAPERATEPESSDESSKI
jgi:hypothetical protein